MIEHAAADLWRIQTAGTRPVVIEADRVKETGHRVVAQPLKELVEVAAQQRLHAAHAEGAVGGVDHGAQQR